MRSKFILLIILFLVISSFFIFRDSKKELPQTRGTTIIAFGDSLVYGYGATEGNDFVSLLSSRIGLPIINAGISGNTTADGVARLKTDVLDQNPRTVIVVLGGNDFLRRVPKSETLKNIRTIVEQIKSTGARVVLIGTSRLVYDRDYEDIAKEFDVIFVPHVMDRILNDKKLMSDAIHPNDAGYKIFADTVEPYLIKALQ